MRIESEVLSRGETDAAVAATDRKGRRQDRRGPSGTAVSRLLARLGQDRMVRLGLMFKERCAETHLKGLVVERADDERRITVAGRQLYSFGSDSFLGLDRHPRVQEALVRAVRPWGTHNGASRIFASVELCEEAERRLARWLGVEDTLIFASVTLANAGLIPALAGEGDLLAVERLSHDSIHQAAKIAAAGGATVRQFYPCRGETLLGVLAQERHQGCVVAVDGVNSMYGTIPPLDELDQVDARLRRHSLRRRRPRHGGPRPARAGRGGQTVGLARRRAHGRVAVEGVLLHGGVRDLHDGAEAGVEDEIEHVHFRRPGAAPYLAAICAVCDIIDSPEYDELLGRLHALVRRLMEGVAAIGLNVLGGESAIIAIVIGDIERTLEAGKWLFDRGYYVQSATFPAVPINGGVLRILVNANHPVHAVDGLLGALAEMKTHFRLPTTLRDTPCFGPGFG